MKRLFIIALTAISTLQAFSQDAEKTPETKDWTLKGSVGINFSQTSFSNWLQEEITL